MEIIFYLVVLIVSVILHELAHGYTANYLGDPTARLAGRLTFNPLKHIDPIGTVLLPAFLALSHSPLIGYAKPVPYNPYNLRGKYDEGLVSGAGPGTNILLAIIFGLAVRALLASGFAGGALVAAFEEICFINLLLALFNLIPLPPLDGSKVLSAILPGRLGRAYNDLRAQFDRLGVLSGTLLVLIVFYFLLLPYFLIILQWFFSLITGL